LGSVNTNCLCGSRSRSCSFMYSPNRRVRFWEQEGHKWKTKDAEDEKSLTNAE
jgi:hypothetical protein